MTRATLDLKRYVPALLTFASNKLSQVASETYRKLFGIGISEWRVLALLAAEPGIPAARMCQMIGFDKALASRVVKKLSEQGLVSVAIDARNSSRSIIHLTPAGEDVHDKVLKVVKERERILHAAFTTEEIDTLVDLLQRVQARAEVVNDYEPEFEEAAPARKRRAQAAMAKEASGPSVHAVHQG